MKCEKNTMLVYAVTGRAWVGKMTLMEQVEEALKKGATCVQLREKELNEADFLAEAKEMAVLCKKYNVPFIINDNVDIAIACGADGVHVGQEDMSLVEVRKKVGSEMIIGVSAHTVEEAQEAERNGADYIGIGAVFATSTKTNVTVMPYERLKEICNSVTIPTTAIGGIKKDNIQLLAGSGVDGVAVVSAIFGAEDPGEATKELVEITKEMIRK